MQVCVSPFLVGMERNEGRGVVGMMANRQSLVS